MQTVISILQNRIDALGVSGATINSQGDNVVVRFRDSPTAKQLLNVLSSRLRRSSSVRSCVPARPIRPASVKGKAVKPTANATATCPAAQYQLTATA